MSKIQKYSTYNTLNILSPKSKEDNLYIKENKGNNTNIVIKKKQITNNATTKEEQNQVKTPK